MVLSSATATLPEQVRKHIRDGLQAWSAQATTEDILRIYKEQISLMFVTEQVRSALAMDPFEHLRENIPCIVLEGLRNSVTVTNYHSVHTIEGYVRTEARVRFTPPSQHARRRNRTADDGVELHFQYTRPTVPPIRVSYTIEMSTDATKPPQTLLWIYIDAVGSVPSQTHAIRSFDGWSDMKDSDDSSCSDSSVNGTAQDILNPEGNAAEEIAPLLLPSIDAEKTDQYEAGMDPELVSQLVHALHLGSAEDVTVFFLLMTFPFYEHEWDMVGFLLEAVFDSGENVDG
jgi:hypothetical protein